MKKAFTLPEAIICVGIVAVIAAIMIPGLIKTRPDEEKLMLKKAYNTASEVISYLTNDVSVFSRMQADGFADSQVYKDLDDVTYSGNTKFCSVFRSKINLATEGTVSSNKSFACSVDFTSIDGIKWRVATNPASTLQNDIWNRKDQENYVIIQVKPPKPSDASWRTINVSRFGRMTIEDNDFADIVADTNLNKG